MKHPKLDKSLRRLRRRRDDPEKTRAYTPGEIHRLAHEKTNNTGVIRPNTGDLNLPAGLDDIGEGQSNSPPKVVFIIVTAALIFIAIITYFVTQMPDPKVDADSQKTERNLINDGRDKSEANR